MQHSVFIIVVVCLVRRDFSRKRNNIVPAFKSGTKASGRPCKTGKSWSFNAPFKRCPERQGDRFWREQILNGNPHRKAEPKILISRCSLRFCRFWAVFKLVVGFSVLYFLYSIILQPWQRCYISNRIQYWLKSLFFCLSFYATLQPEINKYEQ